MKATYDVVFITHLPAFYKVNLYREVAKQCRVLVIYIASASSIRTQDFVASDDSFDSCVLNEGPFESRNYFLSAWRLIKKMKSIEARLVVLGGWDLLEYWMLALCLPKHKNALALESTIYDSHFQGWKSILKRFFLSRVKTVFASGSPHRALLKCLRFKGRVLTTFGVGIFRYADKINKSSAFSGKFLYVGRLSQEKNIKPLIEVFRHLPQFRLSLIGQGPLLEQLKRDCPSNVNILGYVPNTELANHYQQHDIFVLPSLKEPWGLVVEEALYYGLPVIASQRVGCAMDWVKQYQVGMLFDPLDNHSIEDAVLWAAEHYSSLLEQLKRINFSLRDTTQVRKYIEALS